MTKVQLAAALALATSLGAAGGALATKSTELTPVYRVHAMDLRASRTADGGVQVGAQVWADKQLVDGGWKDLGRGNPCPVNQSSARLLLKEAEACVSE